MSNSTTELPALLDAALTARSDLFDERHETALRLFNGFVEGCPDLVADVYARTLVLHNYAEQPEQAAQAMLTAQQVLRERLPWLATVVRKTRNATDQHERNGLVTYGEQPDRRVREHGVAYALNVQINRDASFYLDTRNLRAWFQANMAGKTVLNTFAYTGSLGVAAQAGGATRVVHTDLNRAFLNLAKTSYTLNGFAIQRADFQAGDFWSKINQFKRANERFDCVIVDPPFFAETARGRVDLVSNSQRLINKVRPLINDGGYLVAINNALFVSGTEYMGQIEELCADGYLHVAERIPVPADCTGYPQTVVRPLPTDPAPFNHATKIVVLGVRRKE